MSDTPESELHKRVTKALRDPQNMGEMEGADAVGTVGNSSCGEMLRLWVKFKENQGKKVIDKASFQSFGCETAIAVASMATEIIRGKTPEEALAMSGEQLSEGLGPLPPMKIHCAQLVEGALKAALDPAQAGEASASSCDSRQEAVPEAAPSLLDQFAQPQDDQGKGKVRIKFLPKE